MAKHPRYALALGIFLVAMATGAAAGPKGYLALLGPAPLRFRSRPMAAAHVQLPPLPPPQSESPASSGTNQLAVPGALSPTNQALALPGYSPDALTPPDTISPWLQDNQNPTDVEAGPVNPEAVTGYLVPGATNNVSAPNWGRLALPAFVPPLPPPAPRSSQATYESH
jgi:hypothetical protein